MKALMIAIGILLVLVITGIVFVTQIGIKPRDTKIIDILHENEEDLLSIDGVVGAGIARDENNHIKGIAVYVEDYMTDVQKIPSKLGEFKVFVIKITEASEFEKERMNIYRIYPKDVVKTIFDDSEKINNTAAFLIRTYDPLTRGQIQILRNSGVRVLKTSEIPIIYHSLIEEDEANVVKNLDFVKDVYKYRMR